MRSSRLLGHQRGSDYESVWSEPEVGEREDAFIVEPAVLLRLSFAEVFPRSQSRAELADLALGRPVAQ